MLLRQWVPWTAFWVLFSAAPTPSQPGPVDEPATTRRLEMALERLGLRQIREQREPAGTVEGLLPGQTADEIVLSAHCPPSSRHAAAPGLLCDVALAVAADLRRTPLRHTVRIVLFGGAGTGSAGSEIWLRERSADAGRLILANLNLESRGSAAGDGPVILSAAVAAPGGPDPVTTPGWLAHAVLSSGRAVGCPVAVADRRWPLLAQLVVRSAKVVRATGSAPFLARGIPSLTLADRSLLAGARSGGCRPAGWVQTVAAAVRRLDILAGRPTPEDRYLVAGGRVWLRRDLIWVGFLVWALLVFRGLPGRWRQASAAEHGRQMRAYLPGLLFRALLLVAVFLAPVFVVLLIPAAGLALFRPQSLWTRLVLLLLGFLPFLAYLAAFSWALEQRIVRWDVGFQPGWPTVLLIPAALAAYGLVIFRGPASSLATPLK